MSQLTNARVEHKLANREFFSKKTHARTASALPSHGVGSKVQNAGMQTSKRGSGATQDDPERFGVLKYKDQYGHAIEPNSGTEGLARRSQKNIS